jgi:hypothetical protein
MIFKAIQRSLGKLLAPKQTTLSVDQWPEKYSFNAKVSYYFETGMEGAYLRTLLIDEADIPKVSGYLGSENLFYNRGVMIWPNSQYVIFGPDTKQVWSNVNDPKRKVHFENRSDEGFKVKGYLPSFAK